MSEKPRFLDAIGWSWIIMGALGTLIGLLSVPSFFQLDQIKALVSGPPFNTIPTFSDTFNSAMNWLIPLTIIQTVLSALSGYAGWMFVQGQNWARLTLSFINTTAVVSIFGGFWWIQQAFNRFTQAIDLETLVEAGLMKDVSGTVAAVLWTSALLLMLPLLGLAWYFHCKPVRMFFTNETVS